MNRLTDFSRSIALVRPAFTVALIMILLITHAAACSGPSYSRDEQRYTIVFRELAMDLNLLVNPVNETHAFWHYGIDVGGSGRICHPQEGIRCLVLNDYWTFAIPNEVEETPQVGAKWSYEDWQFQVVETISVIESGIIAQDVIIISVGPRKTSYQFRYNECDGVLAVLEMASEFDPDADDLRDMADGTFESALINPRLYRRDKKCW